MLTGKATLVGVNNVVLVPDNAKESECGNLLSAVAVMGRVTAASDKIEFEALVGQQIRLGFFSYIASPWGRGRIPTVVHRKLTRENWSWEQVKPYFDSSTAYDGRDFDDIDAAAQGIAYRQSVNILDAYIQQERDRESLKDVTPEPAEDFSAGNGWIDRQGNFFICGMIEHDLEKTHVRISTNSMSGYRSSIQFVGRKATKKQRDAVWDWCQEHGQSFPENLFK
jgi:hypothetical protein